ncbi:MAG TPA: hypothetical protein VG410_04615 [Solirubrobacteraceae bacterium]|jgi:hypothetical protein|nr:hypothetical protein [Solirubrobacteraceae bacterium]
MIGVLASAPALPLHAAGKYVAGAYIVFVVALVIYLGIMAIRLGHTQRELSELKREVEQREASTEHEDDLERVG